MMQKQQLIDALTDTFMERCMYFVSLEDYATSHAIYSEFVVDGVDPEDGKYEWVFLQPFPTLI
jgi:hypothetical protein